MIVINSISVPITGIHVQEISQEGRKRQDDQTASFIVQGGTWLLLKVSILINNLNFA